MTESITKRRSGLIVDRRELLKGAAALGLGLGGFAVTQPQSAFAQETPKKGGVFRLGMEGGGTSDSLDPRTFNDSIHVAYGYMLYNGLTEIGIDGEVRGELLEGWHAQPGAKEWIFDVRKDVTFHSGKTLDADDIVYSVNLHRGDTKSPAKSDLGGIVSIEKLSSHQIKIVLSDGDVDLPVALSGYHIAVVPNGFTDFSKPDGTGAYRMESFTPGIRFIGKNTGNYWKQGCGNFDTVELHYIPDSGARLQALTAGQVDAINRVDPKMVDILSASAETQVIRSRGTGYRYLFVALCDTAPFSSLDARLALKYGVERQKIIDTVYQGYATIGNDTLVSPTHKYYAKDIPQRPYDPDKALFHYKKAGSPPIELKVAESIFIGATDGAQLFQESMRQAGIPITITRASSDGYWSDVWLKAPLCSAYWGGRTSINMTLTQAYLSNAPWNDTHFRKPEFDKLVIGARAETDEGRRMEMYSQAQRMIYDDGGTVCYGVGDYLDAYGSRVKGVAPHPRLDMCDHRVAEKAWFA